MGSTLPGQVGLGSIRKVAELERENKPLSSIPPWLLILFVLPGSCFELPSMTGCNL